MAGAGFKTFNTGDVLLASEVNTYLMQQTVMVFDDASARTTALGANVAEGMMSYLKDTNLTYRYDGSSWLSDAGTTSPLTTKGDVWGYSTTDARIPVGANGTVLTADSAESLGVKWATPAAGGFVGCSLYKTSNQTVANLTNAVVTFDAEVFDTDAFHDNSTNNSRVTIPAGKNGKYLFVATLNFDSDSTGRRALKFLKNNTSYYEMVELDASSGEFQCAASIILDLVATDYVELVASQNSGTNRLVKSGATITKMQVVYLGA